MLVQEVMHPDPITITPQTTLCDAYQLMNDKGIRHLPVLDGEQLVGLVTDRDLRLATSRLAKRPFDPDAQVAEIMSHPVQTAYPNDPVEMTTQIMLEMKIGCMPVVEVSRVVGIVTSADLLAALLRLTGVHHPSGRLDIRMSDKPGELARLARLLADANINIHSILTYTESDQRARLVLRVNTMEIHALARHICDSDFEVLWPPHISCAE